jgi:hypothetical protein
LVVVVVVVVLVVVVERAALFTNHRCNYLQHRILSQLAVVAVVNPVTTALLLQETLHPL